MVRRRPGVLLPIEVGILSSGLELQAADGDFYGFALARHLTEGTEGLTAHGTLYKALARLTEAGLLSTEWEDPTIAEAEGRPRRKLYRVTGDGERAHREATAPAATTTPATGRAAMA